ncbi:MAG: hypothetical protein LBE34_13305 [Flavobacteriaceae bacterium]|jgi:hypothetical protein|nr:hypothetical protein [Flavobacteriaceae bacterium]
MKKVYWYLMIGGFLSISSYGQITKKIDGRIRSFDGKVVDTTVLNKTSKETTKGDNTGYFMMSSQKGDTLRFQSKGFTIVNYIIGEEDIKAGRINIIMTKKEQNLEEIIITKKDFGKDFFEQGYTKDLSDAEKLYNQSNTVFSATKDLGLGISLDAFLSIITGKKKKQEASIVYEQKASAINEITEIYPKELIRKDLKIPVERIDSFLLYFVSQPDYNKLKVERSESYQLFLAHYYDEFLKIVKLDK